ncbi:MAG: cytochrome B [Aureispira sp.]
MKGLVHAHSGLRWVVLVLLLWAIVNAFSGWRNSKNYTAGDRKVHLFAMISVHVQILIGFVLYFLNWGAKVNFSNMANSMIRFFSVEHVFMMLIAAILITVGFSRGKRMTDTTARFRFIFYTYLISLVLILAGIPWPFRALGAGWF